MQIGDIMIQYITASKDDIELLMQSRLEMLKVVNDLPADYVYDDAFVANSRAYFYNPVSAEKAIIDVKIPILIIVNE